MTVDSIVRHALRSVYGTASDVSVDVAYSAKRGDAVVRGTVRAFALSLDRRDPLDDSTADASTEGRRLVFRMEGEGAWNHPFPPKYGDVFTVGGKSYAAVSVLRRFGSYYKVEVEDCKGGSPWL